MTHRGKSLYIKGSKFYSVKLAALACRMALFNPDNCFYHEAFPLWKIPSFMLLSFQSVVEEQQCGAPLVRAQQTIQPHQYCEVESPLSVHCSSLNVLQPHSAPEEYHLLHRLFASKLAGA